MEADVKYCNCGINKLWSKFMIPWIDHQLRCVVYKDGLRITTSYKQQLVLEAFTNEPRSDYIKRLSKRFS